MDKDRAAVSSTPCSGGRRDPGRGLIGIGVGLCLLFFMNGCTPRTYNISLQYEPTKIIRPEGTDGRQYSVTVASFIDQRKMEDNLLIGRVITSGGSTIPVLPRYVRPTEAVAAALRELLFKTGYRVAPDRPAWDLDEKTLRPEWGTLIVGGTIDELDVTCVEMLTMKRYTAKVRVTLVFADVQKKRIFYRVVSESSSALDHIFTSEERLEGQLNGVLADAMEKAIEGAETGQRIQEALSQ